MLQLKHKEFLAYVIKDWIADCNIEQSISLEFVDPCERKTILIISNQDGLE